MAEPRANSGAVSRLLDTGAREQGMPLSRWLQQAAFPLALDESLADRFSATPPDELPVKRLVLKAAVMGGVLPLIKYAQRAKKSAIESVVTSALEVSVGLWAAVHVAATFDNHLAHGLGTAEWFEQPDPVLRPVQGSLSTGSEAGLGVSLACYRYLEGDVAAARC